MPKTVQIRHIPDSLHRKLKVRAAMRGLSLSDFLLRELDRIAECPTAGEMMERLARLSPIEPDVPPSQAVRELRESYDRGRRVRSS